MSKATYTCQSCKWPFEARTADRARGWARFCLKSCKAIKQEARTGQYAAYQQSGGFDSVDMSHGEWDEHKEWKF